eukprot:7793010-Pyramimonas_sp.AAC.1
MGLWDVCILAVTTHRITGSCRAERNGGKEKSIAHHFEALEGARECKRGWGVLEERVSCVRHLVVRLAVVRGYGVDVKG